jgi:hypothetical protein
MSTFAKLDPNYAIMNNCDPCAAGKASSMAGAARAGPGGFVTQSAKIASHPIQDNSYQDRLNKVTAALSQQSPSPQAVRAAATGYTHGVASIRGPQY